MKSSNNINTGGGSIIGSVVGSDDSRASAKNVSVSHHEIRGDGETLEEVLAILAALEHLVNRSDMPDAIRGTACNDVASARAALKSSPPDPKRAQTFLGMVGEGVKKAAASETVGAATALLQKGAGLLNTL